MIRVGSMMVRCVVNEVYEEEEYIDEVGNTSKLRLRGDARCVFLLVP